MKKRVISGAAAVGLILVYFFACRQPYLPPAIKESPGYLVVDGQLNAGSDSTVITLSRTRNLDSLQPVPELHAQVSVIGATAQTFELKEMSAGRYGTDHLDLLTDQTYQLKIATADGRIYLSDAISVFQTPPIDSLSWRQDSVGLSVYLFTHDPQNLTRNYRWDYTETWQYHTGINSLKDFVNGRVVLRDNNTQVYNCWKTLNSTSILLASSEKLRNDVISQKLIQQIPSTSEKLSVKYSILVRQYGITPQAYDYWDNLKKNSELRGSIFDPQPSELTGNIHCETNPGETVLGYLGASTVERKRIFISNAELAYWNYVPYYVECTASQDAYVTVGTRPQDQEKLYEYLLMPNHLFTLVDSAIGGYLMVQNYCADCREHGGVNIKPDFWQ